MNALLQLCKTLITAVGPTVIQAVGAGLQEAVQQILNHPPSTPPSAAMVKNLVGHVTLSPAGLKPEVMEATREIHEHLLQDPTAVTK